jgi:hypothetical protein
MDPATSSVAAGSSGPAGAIDSIDVVTASARLRSAVRMRTGAAAAEPMSVRRTMESFIVDIVAETESEEEMVIDVVFNLMKEDLQ